MIRKLFWFGLAAVAFCGFIGWLRDSGVGFTVIDAASNPTEGVDTSNLMGFLTENWIAVAVVGGLVGLLLIFKK